VIEDVNMSESRLAVTPAGHDDIGKILASMGPGYQFEDLSWNALEDPRALERTDVLFANCEGTCSDRARMDRLAPVVRNWIESGGSLYASCWAIGLVEAIWPGLVRTSRSGLIFKTVASDVVDPGLAEFLGTRSLDLQLGGWWDTELALESNTQRFVDAGVPSAVLFLFPLGARRSRTLVWDVRLGEGRIIYTAFHNHDQPSEQQRRLLEYLVLRPVLARAVTGAQRIIEAERCTPGREVVGTLSRSSNTRAFTFDASGIGDALFLLHWNGSTPLRMSVSDPAGRTVYDQSGPAPLRFTAPATRGPWRCTVLGASLPHDNFPFVLTIATRNQGGAPLPPPASPQVPGQAPMPPAAPPATTQPWELSLVIDCSARAADFAPAAGSGLSALLRALRSMPVTKVAPSVAIVPWRSGDLGAATRSPLAALGPVNLACSGELSARACADWLGRALQARPASAAGKPMFVLVLGSEPSDSAAGGLQAIRQLAGPEKANVIAVGLGPMVQGSTLRAIAPLALKVESGSSAETTACFEWIAELARGSIRALEGKGSAFTAPPLPAGVVKV
jgi:uncharacterized protein YegL